MRQKSILALRSEYVQKRNKRGSSRSTKRIFHLTILFDEENSTLGGGGEHWISENVSWWFRRWSSFGGNGNLIAVLEASGKEKTKNLERKRSHKKCGNRFHNNLNFVHHLTAGGECQCVEGCDQRWGKHFSFRLCFALTPQRLTPQQLAD